MKTYGVILLIEGRHAEIKMSVEYEVWDLGVDHQAVWNLSHLRKTNKDKIWKRISENMQANYNQGH